MSDKLKRFAVVFEGGAELEQEAHDEAGARAAAWQHRPGASIESVTELKGAAAMPAGDAGEPATPKRNRTRTAKRTRKGK